jgi:hypothetical protein
VHEGKDHKLYSSKNIWVNDLKRMRLTGNVGYMKLTKYTHKDLVGKSEEARDLCTHTCRQKDNTKTDLTKIGRAIVN